VHHLEFSGGECGELQPPGSNSLTPISTAPGDNLACWALYEKLKLARIFVYGRNAPPSQDKKDAFLKPTSGGIVAGRKRLARYCRRSADVQ
jgi:hypothetical protein